MTNLLRRIKIHQVSPALTEDEILIYNSVKDVLSDMKEYIHKEYTRDFILYRDKDNVFLMEYDYPETTKKLYIRDDISFVKDLSVDTSKYKSEILVIIKYFFEKITKRQVSDIREYNFEISTIKRYGLI
jgi:hypothetical protein